MCLCAYVMHVIVKEGFPYSLPSVGPEGDPSVQAVCQTFGFGYLPSRRALPPLDRYQAIRLSDRGT